MLVRRRLRPLKQGQQQRSMLQGLATQMYDVHYIRSQILQGMMAFQETTAVLIANTMFLLSRHPRYWSRLRHEVRQRGEELLTFENLNNFKPLQNILSECESDRPQKRDKMLTSRCAPPVSHIPPHGPHQPQGHQATSWRRPRTIATHICRERYALVYELVHTPSRRVILWTRCGDFCPRLVG